MPAKVGKTWLQGGNSCHVKPEARGYSFLFRNYQGLFAAWTRWSPGRDFKVNQIQACKNGSNGSIVKFITKGDAENIPYILLNDDSIFHQINKLIEKIELCERENEELTKFRDWILPMLMNGQARVE